MTLKLMPEEQEQLEASERCEACKHLHALHNEHCCAFCTIRDCRCRFGDITEDED